MSRWSVAALALLTIVSAWTAHGFLHAGAFPLGHDLPWHTARLGAFDVAIRDGHIPPVWAGAFYFGYGGPVFGYYPTLLYYLTEPVLLLGANLLVAWRGLLVTLTVGTAWMMYGWLRGTWGRVGALVSAVAVTLAPYHLLDLYVRAAYTEYAAFPCAIGMLWAAQRWADTGRRGAWFALLASTAAMVGLHLGSIVMLGPLTAAWLAALLIGSRSNWRRLLGGWLALGAALALTVGDWAPAFLEKEHVRIDQETQSGYFLYSDHYLSMRELVTPDWGFGISRPNDEEEHTSFQLGLVHWAGIPLGVAALLWAAHRRTTAALLGVCLVSVAMTLPVSDFLWRQSGVLRALQFPWRFLLPAVIAASALLGAPVAALARWGSLQKLIGCVGAVLCVLVYGQYRVAGMAAGPVPPTSRAMLQDWGPGGLGRPEYLPSQYDWKPDRMPPAPVMVPGGGQAQVELLDSAGHRLAFRVTTPAATFLAVERFASPGWRWTLSRPEAHVSVDPYRGTLVVHVPPGTTEVSLRYGLTPLRKRTLLASLLVAGALAAVWWLWPRLGPPPSRALVANGLGAE